MTENLSQRDQVAQVIEQIRPALQADGGDIELVDVVDNVVKVRLVGACAGCPMSQMTLSMQVERIIKQKLPEIQKVVAV
jgi:Fe-S cluster biogenesis protein NfuA